MAPSIFRIRRLAVVLVWLLMVVSLGAPAYGAERVLSHSNTRPLPAGHDRALPAGEMIYVDGKLGDDGNAGTAGKPMKTIQAAVTQASAGQTVVIRAGTYYENVVVSKAGEPNKPITVRAYPKELVVIDAGYPEFYNDPKKAWEPVEAGTDGAVAGEYRSTKTYEMAPWQLCANFGDSMLPLIVYWNIKDLRESQMYWTLSANSAKEEGVYCGPGVYYNAETKRIHIRMAHTTLNMLGEDNYRGVTDPREIPLVIGGKSMEAALTVANSAHVVVQDIVLRGGGRTPASVLSSYDVELNGCTLYAGNTALEANFTNKLRVLHTAFRGACSPWNFRGHMKYRSREAKVLSASGWAGSGMEDLELGYCEFTDSIDGIFIGGVNRTRFHNCFMDNFTDDGIFVSSGTTPEGTTVGGGIDLYENRISRVLTVFAFGVGHGRQLTLDDEKKIKQLGGGVFAYRNIFDFRTPVHYNLPTSASEDTERDEFGRMMGDHGSPTWEPLAFYQNTVVYGGSDGRGLYPWAGALGGGTARRVFNNVFAYAKGMPGAGVLRPNGDLQSDYNLTWSYDPEFKGVVDPYERFKKSADFGLSKKYYAPGWMANDLVADPMFKEFTSEAGTAFDVSLKAGSPALKAGVKLPDAWPDPLRPTGDVRPDIGAMQSHAPLWRIGVLGRFDAFGRAMGESRVGWGDGRAQPAAKEVNWAKVLSRKPVAIVAGYPDMDRPALNYFLKQNQVVIGRDSRTWPDAESLSSYGMIVVVDSPRGMNAPAELADPLKAYVKQGGKLVVLSGATEQFSKMPGFLGEMAGEQAREKAPSFELLIKGHPWTKQLDALALDGWKPKQPRYLPAGNGQIIVGGGNRQALMLDVNYGKGKFVYVGWPLCEDLPRAGSRSEWANTSEMEAGYQAQVDVLKNMMEELYPKLVKLEAPTGAAKIAPQGAGRE